MLDMLVVYETHARLGIFLGFCLVLALLEFAIPRKKRALNRWPRWITNFFIIILDSALVRAVFSALAAVGAAHLAHENGWGLFNIIAWAYALEAILGFLILDFAIWFQHLVSHKVPLFWRFHKMHHADRDVDFSTALRFHPIEILASMAFKIMIVLALGISPEIVILFEIVLNGSALFNHANITIPPTLDKGLRWLIVTPDMHRIHHSIKHKETDSNYGFNLALWDRLFGTYIVEPEDGHQDMILGLSDHQDDKPAQIIWSLWLPFKK